MRFNVMAGHSRPKDGVLSRTYVPSIHVLPAAVPQDVDARNKRGHDGERRCASNSATKQIKNPR